MKTKQSALLFLFCLMAGQLFSQLNTNSKTKKIITKSDTLYLDTLSLVPGSIKLNFANSESAKYKIDYRLHAVIFEKGNRPDTLKISYKTFPYNFSRLLN